MDIYIHLAEFTDDFRKRTIATYTEWLKREGLLQDICKNISFVHKNIVAYIASIFPTQCNFILTLHNVQMHISMMNPFNQMKMTMKAKHQHLCHPMPEGQSPILKVFILQNSRITFVHF